MPKIHDKTSGRATDTVHTCVHMQVSLHMLLIRSANMGSYELTLGSLQTLVDISPRCSVVKSPTSNYPRVAITDRNSGGDAWIANVYDYDGSSDTWSKLGSTITEPGNPVTNSLLVTWADNAQRMILSNPDKLGGGKGQTRIIDWDGSDWVENYVWIGDEPGNVSFGINHAISGDGKRVAITDDRFDESSFGFDKGKLYVYEIEPFLDPSLESDDTLQSWDISFTGASINEDNDYQIDIAHGDYSDGSFSWEIYEYCPSDPNAPASNPELSNEGYIGFAYTSTSTSASIDLSNINASPLATENENADPPTGQVEFCVKYSLSYDENVVNFVEVKSSIQYSLSNDLSTADAFTITTAQPVTDDDDSVECTVTAQKCSDDDFTGADFNGIRDDVRLCFISDNYTDFGCRITGLSKL